MTLLNSNHGRVGRGRFPPAPGPVLRAPSLSDARILIIGINYEPEPTGIAPYTTAMAEHLSGVAASVTVFTGIPHYPSWSVPLGYRRRLRRLETVNSRLKLVRHVHYVPRRQSALTRASYEMSFMANVLANRTIKADLVLAVSPSLGGAYAGSRIAGRLAVPLVTVVQDMMAQAASQSGISGGNFVSGLTANLERHTLQSSDLVAVVSDAFVQQVCGYGVPSKRVRLLPNWVHIEPKPYDRTAARKELGWKQEGFTVLHSGNMGIKQDLGNVVEAARLLTSHSNIGFVLLGDGNQRRALEARAAGLPNLTFVDPVSRDDYPKALAAADLLLVNERPTVTSMSLPSKLTSYMSASRPVLAAVAPDGATARELDRTGGAAVRVRPASPESLAEAVIMLTEDPDRCARLASCGAAYAAVHLGKATAMGRVTELVSDVLGDTIDDEETG